MIRVLLVDDHTLVRAGLARLLEQSGHVEVVGSVNRGEDALTLDAELQPDVVMMDVSMPGLGGIETTRRLRANRPDAVVVMLTATTDHPQVIQAMDAGAVGFLMKDSDPAALIQGVRAAAEGEAPLDSRAAKALINDRTATGPSLTARESEVLGLVGRGLTNKAIARELGIGERTVKAHLTRVFAQIDVSDRTQAALWVKENLGE